MYLSPAQAQEKYGYHPKTLADWADDGKIEYIRSKGGHRRYLESSIVGKPGLAEAAGVVIIYARVSTPKQKNDLETQATALKTNRQGDLVREIGSGMNFKRKKFIKLMERVGRGEISEIVVAHKDRLNDIYRKKDTSTLPKLVLKAKFTFSRALTNHSTPSLVENS